MKKKLFFLVSLMLLAAISSLSVSGVVAPVWQYPQVNEVINAYDTVTKFVVNTTGADNNSNCDILFWSGAVLDRNLTTITRLAILGPTTFNYTPSPFGYNDKGSYTLEVTCDLSGDTNITGVTISGYSGSNIAAVSIDLLIGIGAAFVGLVALIGLVLLFVWMKKKVH